VGDERTHAKLLCQLHRLVVMAFNHPYVGRIRTGGDVGQETEGVSLETTFPTLAREREGTPDVRRGFVVPIGQSARFGETSDRQ
jgi:hypothetical protein